MRGKFWILFFFRKDDTSDILLNDFVRIFNKLILKKKKIPRKHVSPIDFNSNNTLKVWDTLLRLFIYLFFAIHKFIHQPISNIHVFHRRYFIKMIFNQRIENIVTSIGFNNCLFLIFSFGLLLLFIKTNMLIWNCSEQRENNF